MNVKQSIRSLGRRLGRLVRSAAIIGPVLTALATAPGVGQAALPSMQPDGTPMLSLAPMLDVVRPAVVNIATYATVQTRNPLLEDPFFRRFFDLPDTRRRYRRTQSAGSGVVVDATKGYVVTNHHVVARADEIAVTLSDGRTLQAELVGADHEVDLAVLKVAAEDLVQVAFADSSALRVGDYAIAIGNPFGLSQTVTSGIVSALGRTGLGIEGVENFIQTDASINPGNSGGALVDLHGRLIGINTAIIAPAGGNIGIGFAIPANMVRAVMGQLITHGKVRRGYLGVSVQELNPELARAFDVERASGVVVVDVEPGSIGERAGVQAGDVIVAMGGRGIETPGDFHSQAAVTFVGSSLDLDIVRQGKRRTLAIEVVEDQWDNVPGERASSRLAGTLLQNFRDASDAQASGSGVLVTEVDPESVGFRFGLRPGDVLVGANRRKIGSISDLRKAANLDDRQLLLRVYRAGEFGYVALR